MKSILEHCLSLYEKREPFVVVTLFRVAGSAPAELGAKAVVTQNGLISGTIGGGKVELKIIEYCQSLLKESRGRVFSEDWNLQTDAGMTCGGEVSFLFESVRPVQWRIAVFGAGHVAQALVRVLITLDCFVQCIDPRAEWLEQLPESYRLENKLEPVPSLVVDALPNDTYVLVMTHGHAYDTPILEAVLGKPFAFPYVGVIGSEQKGKRIKAELLTKGILPERLEKLYCPMGLEIGTNSPGEIAISITAQLLQVRKQLQVGG